MNKLIAIMGGALLTLASTVTLAAESGTTGTGAGPNPFSDCGIGAALFPNTGWAAATSNVTWDVGTTAVTSATASPETCSAKKVEVAEFINHSYDNLITETAQGEGQYISALLNIYGCNVDSRKNIVADMRAKTGAAVNNNDYSSQDHLQKITTYYQIVDSAVALEASCSA
ncbi:MAG: hypothetical protein ACI9MF_002321 [Gammaproteobacteria bacterium]|jgi:hypothetical protein